MRFSALVALSIVALLFALGAAQVLADFQGDDLVVCCDVFPPAPSSSAPAAASGCGLVPRCTPIDGSIASINRCNGIVMGCAESAFLCTPSTTEAGKQDCTCAGLVGLLCPPTKD